MKISFDVAKFKKGMWLNVVKHHDRLGNHQSPDSQLPKDKWLTARPMYTLRKTDWAKLKAADAQIGTKVDGVAVRRDAVAVVGLHFQLGHSSLWRDSNGKPLPSRQRPNLKKLAEQAVLEAERIYGKENIAGAVLHCDETAPHVEVYVTPIRDGRLNAKSFIDGPGALSQEHIKIFEGYKAAGFDVEHPDTGAGLGGADLDGLEGVAGLIRAATSPAQNEVLKYQLRKSQKENLRLSQLVKGKQKVIVQMGKQITQLDRHLANSQSETAHLKLELASVHEKAMALVREKIADYESTVQSLRRELGQLRASIAHQIQRGIDAVIGRDRDSGPEGPSR